MHLKVVEGSESGAGSTEGDKWGGAGKSRLCEEMKEAKNTETGELKRARDEAGMKRGRGKCHPAAGPVI